MPAPYNHFTPRSARTPATPSEMRNGVGERLPWRATTLGPAATPSSASSDGLSGTGKRPVAGSLGVAFPKTVKPIKTVKPSLNKNEPSFQNCQNHHLLPSKPSTPSFAKKTATCHQTHSLHISPHNACAKFSQRYFEVCILEPLLNRHFISHHLRMPEYTL